MFSLLVILASVQVAPHILSEHAFRAALQPLYAAALTDPLQASVSCDDLNLEAISRLTGPQRLAAGSSLISLMCAGRAAQILPEPTASSDRPALLAFQWGRIAWAEGDARRAATIWRQGHDIDRYLLARARNSKTTDSEEAQRWYEAAIMAANSLTMQAESITALSEELRGRISPEAFGKGLLYLESCFGEDTAVGYRLRGERFLRGGDYPEASEQLSQAIALGFADAETWYLLGDAAWRLNDLPETERAYRLGLNARVQIAWRRPWHLSRLAAFLASTGRPREALLFQEESVRLSDYYPYADDLAVLYDQLGEEGKAHLMCARARVLAGSARPSLRCEAS
jgi:tetratricopeptide (TPR) repeat protein